MTETYILLGVVVGLVLAVFLGALVAPIHRRRASIDEIETNAPTMGKALADVWNERARQISVEGWTPKHDDEHDAGEMATAAACYAEMATYRDEARKAFPRGGNVLRDRWPWGMDSWKPKDRRSDLVRAGALIVAEIERLDRAAAKATAT